MKYTQSYKNRKSRFLAGLYAVVAICIMMVGGASYFAVNKVSKAKPEADIKSEYKDKGSSYIDSVPEVPEISEPTTQSAESVPFESDAVETKPAAETKPQTETKPQALNFTLPVSGAVLKDYSAEHLQYSATYGDMRMHNGIDIECEKGTAVSSCADGTVLSVEKTSDFGVVVTIDHTAGITVKYSALSDVSLKQSDTVKMGDIIGKADTVPSECGDKSHIHIEVYKDGKLVNPLKTLGLS